MKKFGFSVLIAAMLVLAGCSTPSIQKSAAIEEWHGRFSITLLKDGKADRNSGTFLLTSSAEQKELILKGPLGANAATLTENSDGAVLAISNEEPIKARRSQEITERVIGAPLDLTDLVDWLSAKKDAQQSEKELAASGWELTAERNSENKLTRIMMKRQESYRTPAVTLILLPR
ncbi:lipoprotein insertase outer membrane protein LolB [uncultured Turicimonas sp.]|uniref:lipoprotein insertase outer membrane protein LolB n=1 Tax=uncultured Turicimonas sp. TaxID=1918607 RepID=UPI0028038EDB|nr:lipoprotein insertase outer membrane protein LolB [uncultured Turicimonas sp.]